LESKIKLFQQFRPLTALRDQVKRIYYVRERVGIIKISRQHGSKNLALVKDNSAGK